MATSVAEPVRRDSEMVTADPTIWMRAWYSLFAEIRRPATYR